MIRLAVGVSDRLQSIRLAIEFVGVTGAMGRWVAALLLSILIFLSR